MAEKKDNVTSKFKDNVFCMLYRDKKNLLELYNALNNSAYTNVDDLQVTTLKLEMLKLLSIEQVSFYTIICITKQLKPELQNYVKMVY